MGVALRHMCYDTELRRSRSNRYGVHKSPKNVGETAPPPWAGDVAAHWKHTVIPLQICYHTKFCRPRSNRLGVSRITQNLKDAVATPPWDEGVADPLESRYYPTCVTNLPYQIWSL